MKADDYNYLTASLRGLNRSNKRGLMVSRARRALEHLHEVPWEGTERLRQIYCIREALRTALNALREEVRVSCNMPNGSQWVFHIDLTPGSRELAQNIANTARLLPDPHPCICPDCQGVSHSVLSTGFSECCPSHPLPTVMHRKITAPAPTHALSIYIDALRLFKGKDWYHWLGVSLYRLQPSCDYWGGFFPRSPTNLESSTTVYVSNEGRMVCGETCSKLPLVIPGYHEARHDHLEEEHRDFSLSL